MISIPERMHWSINIEAQSCTKAEHPYRTMAERGTRSERMKSVHKPAMIRSRGAKVGRTLATAIQGLAVDVAPALTRQLRNESLRVLPVGLRRRSNERKGWPHRASSRAIKTRQNHL